MSDAEIIRLRDRTHDLANDVTKLEGKQSAHEQVCAERQGAILKRLGRIEGVFYLVAAASLYFQWDQIKALLRQP